jgi:hypothetical protein
MALMLRRFVLLAVAATIGIAPVAHEFCQVSCATPVASTPQAGTGHEHCAQSVIDDYGNGAKMSAARVSECRSQANDAAWTSAFTKGAAPAPAILLQDDDRVVAGASTLVQASSSPPAAVSVRARTQLRV